MADQTSSSAPDVPNWLNTALIQEAVSKQQGEPWPQVVKMAVRPATAPGDNYTSFIFRVKISMSDGTERSLLVKGPTTSEVMASSVRESGFFNTETNMLSDIVPQMETLLEAAAPGKFPAFAARCPAHGTAPVEYLVLEDLAPQGFRLADRLRGLGLRHCLLALRALARYHAASHAFLQKEPGVAQLFKNHWAKSKEGEVPFVVAGLKSTAAACRSWSGFEDIARLLDKLRSPEQMKKLVKAHDTKPEYFNVISHGDFMTNNMMFRYEDGIPIDIRLVDHQLCNVVSPAIDLLYFFSTSTSEEVSERHEDMLLREYYAELRDVMKLLGHQAPSLEDILKAMDIHSSFAVFGLTCVVPIIRVKKAMDIGARKTGDESMEAQAYHDPVVTRWLQRCLPLYQRRGWLSE